jgi:hypothetical protein
VITTLSKILASVPNCNIRVDTISYETSDLGFAQLEGYVVDVNGVELFPINLPVAVHAVPDLVNSIHDNNKVPQPSNLRKLRVTSSDQTKK